MLAIAFGFIVRVDAADLQVLRLPFSVVLRCAAGSEVVRCTSNPICQPDGDGAAIVVLHHLCPSA
jgi:hypothetical protein